MPTYEALVHVVDPKSFVKDVYKARNSLFKAATIIESAGLSGPRTTSAPGDVMSIRSEDRLNVEDVLLVDLDMDVEEAESFIREVRFSGEQR